MTEDQVRAGSVILHKIKYHSQFLDDFSLEDNLTNILCDYPEAWNGFKEQVRKAAQARIEQLQRDLESL